MNHRERPTRAAWCPVHRYSTADHCPSCAGDHKAGEHLDAPSHSCRLCTEPTAPAAPAGASTSVWTPTAVLATTAGRGAT